MDVLTDSSLTLIVKTSEQDNANALENTGGDSALLPHIHSSDSHLLTECTVRETRLQVLPKFASSKEFVRINEILMT